MISVVVPAFNEEAGLEELHRRIGAAAETWSIEGVVQPLELIVVDDGSTDRTLSIAARIATRDPRFKVVSLTRNFGHQLAVSAGLAHARGDVVVVMDADLQDPPEALGPFFAKLDEGYDVIYAVRTARKEGLLKRLAYRIYYRLLKRLATLDIPLDAGDFCVMRGSVVRELNRLPERNRFVRGLRTWVGYRQTGIPFERGERYAGESKYTLGKLFQLAFDGIVNFSYRPLHLIAVAGVVLGMCAVLLGILVLIQYITDWTIWGFNPHQARGWTSLILVLLFVSATQLFCLGILGEYIGRLFEEVKQRPLYLVQRRINIDAPGEQPRPLINAVVDGLQSGDAQ